MDPFTLLIFSCLISWAAIKTVPEVVADTIATIRASKAGKWDLIDKDRTRKADARERRTERRERWAQAWAERRRLRHERAGGIGPYRPGFRDYIKDCNHAYWEKQLAKNANLRPLQPGEKPTWRHRLFDATADKYMADHPGVFVDQYGDPLDNQNPDEYLTPGFEPGQHKEESVDWIPIVVDGEELMTGSEQWPHPDFDIPKTIWVEDADAADAAEQARKQLHLVPAIGDKLTSNGGTMTAHSEVLTNADVRTNAATIAQAACEMHEGLAIYEAARARAAAAYAATADAMSATAFDSGATTAVGDIGDHLDAGAMTHLAEVADSIAALAMTTSDELDKYRDAEDLVASTGVHTDTLASTSS